MQQLISQFSIFNSKEFVFLVIFAILILNIFYFLWSYFSTKSLLKNSIKAFATVSQVQEMEGPNGQYQQLTLIFRDQGGVEFAPIFENMFTPRQKGQNVEIFYVKNDPSNVVINDWRSLRMRTFISFLGIVVTSLIGYFMLRNGYLEVPAYFQELLKRFL